LTARIRRSSPGSGGSLCPRGCCGKRHGRGQVLQLSPDGQAVVNSFEADLAARLGRLTADWPARKRQAAASAVTAPIEAIQHDLAEQDQAEQDEAGADAGNRPMTVARRAEPPVLVARTSVSAGR
jgi:hypothetical protein